MVDVIKTLRDLEMDRNREVKGVEGKVRYGPFHAHPHVWRKE